MTELHEWAASIGELDLHLIAEGRHERLWEVLGAHVRTLDGPGGPTAGTSFAVWAPGARSVQVAGDFNGWGGDEHVMRPIGSGVWNLFVPGVGHGAAYKFRIEGADGTWVDKADPMAFGTEVPPATASVVTTSSHVWRDDAWSPRARRRRRWPHP